MEITVFDNTSESRVICNYNFNGTIPAVGDWVVSHKNFICYVVDQREFEFDKNDELVRVYLYCHQK